MPSPTEGPVEHLRNLIQALSWASGDEPYGDVEMAAMCDRAEAALKQVEQLQKDKDLYERLYHEYEARDQLDQDHADYVGSAFPTREAMRGVQPVDYPLQQTDLTAEERSHRVAGQPNSEGESQ